MRGHTDTITTLCFSCAQVAAADDGANANEGANEGADEGAGRYDAHSSMPQQLTHTRLGHGKCRGDMPMRGTMTHTRLGHGLRGNTAKYNDTPTGGAESPGPANARHGNTAI